MNSENTKTNLSEDAEILLEKRIYDLDDKGWPVENFSDVARRVAKIASSIEKDTALADELAKEFFKLISSLTFLPNSSALMNCGGDTLFYGHTINLAVENSLDIILDRLNDAIKINQSEGGVSINFSEIAPRGERTTVKGELTAGPLAYIEMFDSATSVVKKTCGEEHLTNSAFLRIDHPDIEEFIRGKSNINNFNLTVLITDDFFKALEGEREFALVNPVIKTIVKEINPDSLLDLLSQSINESGSPKIIFHGASHIPNCEQTITGSINLTKILNNDESEVEFDKLKSTALTSKKLLENLIKASEPAGDINQSNISISVMGFADILIKLGIVYGSTESTGLANKIASTINDAVNINSYIYTDQSLSIIAGVTALAKPLKILAVKKLTLGGIEVEELLPIFKAEAEKQNFYSEGLINHLINGGELSNFDKEIPDETIKLFVTARQIEPDKQLDIIKAFNNTGGDTIMLSQDLTQWDIKTAIIVANNLKLKSLSFEK